MVAIPFTKMHGLGNDFAIFDARERPFALTAEQVRRLADRHRGIGFDELIILEPSARADVFMRIRNPDGAEVGACGNATRCVAKLVGGNAVIETLAGPLQCRAVGEAIEVDMGPVRTDWNEVPLATAQDTTRVDLTVGPLVGPVCCNVGNPHATFFVLDAEAVDVQGLGPLVEHHPLFPERVNVGFATVLNEATLRLRMWERGVGLTLACGSGACAAAVAAHRRGFAGREVTVHLDGGPLHVVWRKADDHVLMCGPAALVYRGTVDVDAVLG